MNFYRRYFSKLPPASPIATAPEEAFLAFICLVSGFALQFSGVKAPSMEALLPGWIIRVWATELMFGGALVLLGMFVRRHRIEQVGLVTLAFACPVYAVALITIVGPAESLVSITLLLAYAAACARRAWLIQQSERVQVLIAQAAADIESERDA